METKENFSQNPFLPLIGEQLSAVCFVQDYMQLDFDGYKLTTYTTPIVRNSKNDNEIVYSMVEYKNSICDLIARVVREVVFEDSSYINIHFINSDKSIKIFLHTGVDNVYYCDHNGKWFVL